MSLQAKLNKYKAGMQKKAPKEALEIMHRATEDLCKSATMESVIKIGDQAPNFELQNTSGDLIRLVDLIADGPLVLSFYRGKW